MKIRPGLDGPGREVIDRHGVYRTRTKQTPGTQRPSGLARKCDAAFVNSANTLIVMDNDMIVPTLIFLMSTCCIGRASLKLTLAPCV